ncbi:MAG: TIR domain-containing protein, partial [Propionicimonas sp.]
MTEGSIGRIFISYRRQETAWPARQLYEVLVARFGAASVFKDVDDIEPGDDFVDRITDAVAACDVLLALIGPQWLTMTDDKGRRRLDNPEDFVRLEVKAALSRNVRVVPILVDGARMPPAEELPDDLAAITRRQAVEINPVGFNTERLLATLAGKPQAKRFGGPTTGGAAEDTDVRLGEAREPSDSGPPVASAGGSASSEAGTWVVASQDPSPSPAVSVVPAEPMPPSEPMPPVGLPPPVGLAPSPGPAPSFPGPELSVPLAPSRGSASSAWSSSSPGSSPGSTSVPGAGSSQGSGSVPGSASSPRSGSSEESTSVPGSGYSEGYFPGSGYSEGYSAGSGYPSGSGSSQESASSPRSASSVGMVSSTSPAGTPWPGTAQASPVPQAPVPPLTSAEPPTSSGGAGAPVPPLAASEGPTTSDPSQVAPPASWESSLPPLGPPELSWEPPVPPLTPRQPPTRPGRNLILAGAAAVVVGLVGVLLLWRPWAPVTSVSVAT